MVEQRESGTGETCVSSYFRERFKQNSSYAIQ